jgi:hypothetical protein
MLNESIQTGNSLIESGITTNINERVKYTANTGTAFLSTANTLLDGTGTTVEVIRGASNGTLVKTLTIKAQANTTRGMIRLFMHGGAGAAFTILIDEIDVSAVVRSSIAESFEISYDLDYFLAAGDSIYASTEKAERFLVIAEGLDFSYP